MTTSNLKFIFKTSSMREAIRLAAAFAHVANEMAEQKKSLNHNWMMTVGVDGEMGAGKSTFLSEVVERIIGGKKYKPDHFSWNLSFDDKLKKEYQRQTGEKAPGAHTKPIWSNYVLEEVLIQHRIFDSFGTGPYRIGFGNDEIERMAKALNDPLLPERRFPGIDFVEHADKVPPALLDCHIGILKDKDGVRYFHITLPDDMREVTQARFQYINDLKLS